MTRIGRALAAPAQTLTAPHAQAGCGRPLGILAGGGTLPLEIAAHARRNGRSVHVVALQGEADVTALAALPHTVVNWGQIGGMIAALRRNGCADMVFAGTVRRPNLRSLRPDLGLFLGLPRLLRTLRGGDDSVLRRVIAFFEHKGFTVVGVADVAPHLLASEGPLGVCGPSASHQAAIARGLDLLEVLGPFDVGQAVVATADQIVAIEGAGGTDAMLGQLPQDLPEGAVLIKWPKPGQELRLDLPAVGPRTIDLAVGAGLAGIAVQTRGAVLLERDALRAAADAAGLFVTGLPRERHARPAEPEVAIVEGTNALPIQVRTRRLPSTRERIDIAMACRLVTALQSIDVGESVVIARQHVLAVSAKEPLIDVVDRAVHLRQWGSKGRRRVGVAVTRARGCLLSDAEEAKRVVERVAKAGLAGLVVTSSVAASALATIVPQFDRAGLFLMTAEVPL